MARGFDQPAASREALQEALDLRIADRASGRGILSYITGSTAQKLAAQAGVSERTAQRWQNFLNHKGTQERKPSAGNLEKLAKAAPGPLTVHLKGHIWIGFDPTYRVFRDTSFKLTAEEAARLFSEDDPDVAWDIISDLYGIPESYFEDDVTISFK